MRVRLIKLRESSKSSLHAILTLCDVVQGGQDGGMLRRSRCSLRREGTRRVETSARCPSTRGTAALQRHDKG